MQVCVNRVIEVIISVEAVCLSWCMCFACVLRVSVYVGCVCSVVCVCLCVLCVSSSVCIPGTCE